MTLPSRTVKTPGIISTEEVNDVIARADRMRETDEKETKRVVARTALETFCQELKFGLSWSQTDRKSQMLMDSAQDCLEWLKQNKGANEATIQRKLQQLERESGKAVGDLNNNYGASRLTLETCFSSGERCLTQSDIPGACDWFFKAYKKAGTKVKEKRYQAVLWIGEACRKYTNMEADPGEVEKFILRGAHLLVFELKARVMNTFCFELVAELGKLKDVFFNKVSKHDHSY